MRDSAPRLAGQTEEDTRTDEGSDDRRGPGSSRRGHCEGSGGRDRPRDHEQPGRLHGPGRAAGDPGRGGSADSCPRWSPSTDGLGRGRRSAPDARAQRRARGVLGQAVHGEGLRGRPRRAAVLPVPRHAERGDRPDPDRRSRAHAARGLGAHPARAARAGGAAPRPPRREGSHHRPGVLQRRPAAGHEDAGRIAGSTCSGSSTSRPRPASRTGSSGGRSDRRYDLGGTFDTRS